MAVSLLVEYGGLVAIFIAVARSFKRAASRYPGCDLANASLGCRRPEWFGNRERFRWRTARERLVAVARHHIRPTLLLAETGGACARSTALEAAGLIVNKKRVALFRIYRLASVI